MRFLALLLVLSSVAFGRAVGDANDPVLSSYFFVPKNQTILAQVAEKFEIHHRHGDGFEVIVPAHKAGEMLAMVPDARLLELDIHAWMDRLSREHMAGYHDFTTVESHLKKIVAEHPEIASMEVYGKSKEGRPLFALKLSDNVAADESETEVMLTSSTHGDELISVEVLFGILDGLVAGYGVDPRLTKIVENTEIWFLPVVNPDGYVRKSRYANGVDPNRDYPWPEMPDRNPNECIKAVMDFFHKHEIKGSIDFHASGGMYMYPWSYTTAPVSSADQKFFAAITKKMAALNGYTHGQIPHLLYIAKGSSADYYYWKGAPVAMAAEVGTSKIPSSSQIGAVVKENLGPTYLFLESL